MRKAKSDIARDGSPKRFSGTKWMEPYERHSRRAGAGVGLMKTGVTTTMSQRISDFDAGLMMTLDALLKDKNVTHAAARLNITQSALSARLTRLRQLLNDPLFIPAASGRGMIATPHAVALEPELARLLERFNDFVNTAHLFDPATSKRIFHIAATDNPAAILAPDLIPLFQTRAPLAKIAFTLPHKARIADHLEKGEVDLFVGAAEDAAAGLIGQTLFQEEFVTAQRRGHPRGSEAITLDEFCDADHLLISTSGGHFSGMIDNALAEIGRERRVSVSIQSYALAPLCYPARIASAPYPDGSCKGSRTRWNCSHRRFPYQSSA